MRAGDHLIREYLGSLRLTESQFRVRGRQKRDDHEIVADLVIANEYRLEEDQSRFSQHSDIPLGPWPLKTCSDVPPLL
jgi:hypothetical protein